MKLLSLKILKGPSLWGHAPIAKCVLEISQPDEKERKILLERWQCFQKHFTELPNCEFYETDLAQAFSQLAFHLQSDPRHPGPMPKIEPETTETHVVIGIPYIDQIMVTKACASAAQILTPKISVFAKDGSNLTAQQSVSSQILNQIKKSAKSRHIADGPAWLLHEFRKRNIPCELLFENILLLGQGKFQKKIFSTFSHNTTYIGGVLSHNKIFTHRILQSAYLPVPPQKFVTSEKMALSAAVGMGYPVVLKPQDGQQGKNVFVDLTTTAEVVNAYKTISSGGQQVIVEKMIEGEEYRLLVIGGKFIAATHRTPGHLVGDGKKTIRELLQIRNRPYRGKNLHKLYLKPLKFDIIAKALMETQGYTLDSYLPEDTILYLRKASNISSGGIAKNVSNEVHPEVKAMAERTAKTIGLDMCGIDYLTKNIRLPPHEAGGEICEVNACPGFDVHIGIINPPMEDLFTPILNIHYPENSQSRMTHIVICAEKSPDDASDALFDRLKDNGNCPGFYKSGKAYFGTDEPTLNILSPMQASGFFVHHIDLDICLWSMTYAELSEFGLPQDKIDLIIDMGTIENPRLKDLLINNAVVYQQASAVDEGGNFLSLLQELKKQQKS